MPDDDDDDDDDSSSGNDSYSDNGPQIFQIQSDNGPQIRMCINPVCNLRSCMDLHPAQPHALISNGATTGGRVIRTLLTFLLTPSTVDRIFIDPSQSELKFCSLIVSLKIRLRIS